MLEFLRMRFMMFKNFLLRMKFYVGLVLGLVLLVIVKVVKFIDVRIISGVFDCFLIVI